MSYVDETTRGMFVAHCDDVACGNATVTVVAKLSGRTFDPTNQDEQTSLAIGIDGLPLLLFPDDVTDPPSVAHCRDIACAASDSIVTVDTGVFMLVGSLAISSDGLPVIACLWKPKRTAGAYELILAHCQNITCAAP
jgi:hypothetical protein